MKIVIPDVRTGLNLLELNEGLQGFIYVCPETGNYFITDGLKKKEKGIGYCTTFTESEIMQMASKERKSRGFLEPDNHAPGANKNLKVAVFIPVYEDIVSAAEIFIGPDAEAEATKAFHSHTGVFYEAFQVSEDRDELLREGDTIMSYVAVKEFPVSVQLTVKGGTVQDEMVNPYGIDVQVNDLDLKTEG